MKINRNKHQTVYTFHAGVIVVPRHMHTVLMTPKGFLNSYVSTRDNAAKILKATRTAKRS